MVVAIQVENRKGTAGLYLELATIDYDLKIRPRPWRSDHGTGR